MGAPRRAVRRRQVAPTGPYAENLPLKQMFTSVTTPESKNLIFPKSMYLFRSEFRNSRDGSKNLGSGNQKGHTPGPWSAEVLAGPAADCRSTQLFCSSVLQCHPTAVGALPVPAGCPGSSLTYPRLAVTLVKVVNHLLTA